MEEQMNFILMPSLQLRALIKTVTTLCNQDDVRAFIEQYDLKSGNFIQVVEDKVIEKVQMLPLPESLKKKVSDFIKPILMEVLRWLNYHEVYYFVETFRKENLNKICWTPQGTVDTKKTAEAIIRDKNVDIKKRYEIACMYCLKNDIFMLWSKMPEDYRKNFYGETYLTDFMKKFLVVLWTRYVKGELSEMEFDTIMWHGYNPYKHALVLSVMHGNQVTTEYFLEELNYEDREQSLVRSARLFCRSVRLKVYSHYTDVLCFLLLQMNEEQVAEVLRNYPLQILICLLEWPWQGFFMEMAKRIEWTFLCEDTFYLLLKLFIKKIKDGFNDYNYQKLFIDFWKQSPISHKEYHIAETRILQTSYSTTRDYLILHLHEVEDKENVKLILEHLTTPVD